jgi:hypothetical protein
MQKIKNGTGTTIDGQRTDKLYMESNMLRIAGVLFCHDQKVARKRTAEIELNAGVIEKHITIRPDPKLGQPGPLAHKIFICLAHPGRTSVSVLPNPKRLPATLWRAKSRSPPAIGCTGGDRLPGSHRERP